MRIGDFTVEIVDLKRAVLRLGNNRYGSDVDIAIDVSVIAENRDDGDTLEQTNSGVVVCNRCIIYWNDGNRNRSFVRYDSIRSFHGVAEYIAGVLAAGMSVRNGAIGISHNCSVSGQIHKDNGRGIQAADWGDVIGQDRKGDACSFIDRSSVVDRRRGLRNRCADGYLNTRCSRGQTIDVFDSVRKGIRSGICAVVLIGDIPVGSDGDGTISRLRSDHDRVRIDRS